MKLLLLFPLTASLAIAAPRMSVNYTISAEAASAAGLRATSANYTNDGSAGAIAGISTIAAPAETAKAGYVAQLYDVTGLMVNSATPDVNEAGTLQLAAWQLLDDATFLAVGANAVTWSVVSGPVTSVSASGIATAGLVYQNTSATVEGMFGSFTGSLNFTVLDTIPDNFGSYAGDGIGDAWQVQYFGQNNPLAAPNADPDGDGQNNLLEFRAGYAPTDPQSRFVTRGVSLAGGVFSMQLSRVQPGTRYVFERTTDFVSWTDVLTLDPAAVAAPFTQALPTSGTKSLFRVRLEAAP